MAIQEQIARVRDFGPRSINFIQEVWSELKKVHWPARNETYAATALVLVIIALIGFYLGLVDFVLSQVVQVILR